MTQQDSDLPDFDLNAHDPALAERLRLGEANEEVALVVNLTDHEQLPDCARLVSRFGDIATIRVQRHKLPELLASSSVRSAEAPRSFRSTDLEVQASELDDLGDELEDDVRPRSHRPSGLRGKGTGTCVGCLDWGFDFAHPDFRNSDGTTRFLSIWDQRSRFSDDDHPNRFGYGRIYSREEINAALREDDPYDALGYDPRTSDRRRSGRWTGTHGTHVLSIAAGNGRAGGPEGIAPKADLIAVHLSGTTPVLSKGSLGDSATILEALDQVFEAAGAKPCVINMSVGAHGGPHDGTTHVERGIDQAVTERLGRAVVNSAGNYRERETHVQGRLKPGERRSFGLRVPGSDPTTSEIEFYYKSADRMRFDVFGPSGELVIALEQDSNAPLEVEGKIVGHAYHYRHHGRSDTKDRHIDMFLKPNAPSGNWRVELVGESVSDGRFDGWIERDSGLSPVFVGPDVAERTTTGTLCNGTHSITTGALDVRGSRPAPASFSSSGPTRDGRLKPEIVAPGVRILAAKSTPPEGSSESSRYTAKSGTSMAAPHVAGTIAVMFEAAGKPLDITDLRASLLSSVRRDKTIARPTTRNLHLFGHGQLDMVAAEKAARRLADDNLGDAEVEHIPEVELEPETQPVIETEVLEEELVEEPVVDCSCGEAAEEESESAEAELPEIESLLDEAAAEPAFEPEWEDNQDWFGDDTLQYLPETDWLETTPLHIPETIVEPEFAMEQPILPSEELHNEVAAETFTPPSSVRDWADLIRFRPSRAIQRQLTSRGFRVQWIGSAASTNVNLDYYPVYVRQMPMLRGRRLTAGELYVYFRRNINDFLDTDNSEFTPFQSRDRASWLSSSPLGSIIYINIYGPDNAYVVCSEQSGRHWRFSTLTRNGTINDDDHPVSGTREFGYEGTDTHAVFYTKGADRARYPLEVMNRMAFSGGHDLWVSFQREFVNWVNRHGGRAMRFPVGPRGEFNISRRRNWARVRRSI